MDLLRWTDDCDGDVPTSREGLRRDEKILYDLEILGSLTLIVWWLFSFDLVRWPVDWDCARRDFQGRMDSKKGRGSSDFTFGGLESSTNVSLFF